MNIFYIPAPAGPEIILPEDESLHCVRVLRMKEGEEIQLVDGLGSFYRAKITRAHDKHCEIMLVGEPTRVPKRSYSIHLAIAPTKSIDRFEWFLEKSTEIGVDVITPLWCEHSERTVLKHERLQKVLVAAMKQSMQGWLPRLEEPVKFRDFVKNSTGTGQFICSCPAGPDQLLKKLATPGSSVTLLIGPEGDFSGEEINLALSSGFIECSLGSSRLRTETAGIIACHTIHILND